MEPILSMEINARLIRASNYKSKLTPAQRHWKRCAKWCAFALKMMHKANAQDPFYEAWSKERFAAHNAFNEAQINQRFARVFD